MSQKQFNIMLKKVSDFKKENQEDSEESAILIFRSENKNYCFMKISKEFKFTLNSTSSGKVTAIINKINIIIKTCVKDKSQMLYFHDAQTIKKCIMR